VLGVWAFIAGFRRRHANLAVVTLSALSLIFAGLAASSGTAVASVGSDQTDIARLEQQIAAQGAHAQSLVSQYNKVQAHLNVLDVQIARDRSRLVADQRVEADASSAMRAVALQAYVSGRGTDSTLAMFSGQWSVSRMLEQNQYLGTVNAKFDDELTTLRLDEVSTKEAEAGLRSEQTDATKTLRQLATARNAATAAIASDETTLTHVKGNLRSLLAAAYEQRQAEQQAAERALAAAAQIPVSASAPLPSPATSTTQPSASPSTPTTRPTQPPTSSGGYANPLRGLVGLSSERIDQGVDYSGFGPIYAIGDGVVLNTVGGGWPGGTFIAYRLTNGPANGLVVFAAEDIEPSVEVGQTVTSGTVIGRVYAGPDGIETGWADASSLPDTMAHTYGQFDGQNSSAFGYNFSQLLQLLGAPGGLPNGPPVGELPTGWPSW